MSAGILGFQEIDSTKLKFVGGKGASLGELSRIEGILVPDGFCISTDAFKRVIGEAPSINALLDRLSLLTAEKREQIGELSAEIRRIIEGLAIPGDMYEEITHYLSRLGENDAYAVRSSATAEDLPSASFAGQQDTYLNIIGKEAILKHLSKCWASLFTDRAVIYRIQNGFDHRKTQMAVVIQKMVFPRASGVLFTADPHTSNRKLSSIDAGFGLGEALVSGLVNADGYKVRAGKIIDKKVSGKKMAVYALKEGGTKRHGIEPEQQNTQVLTDEQILQLAHMGRKIETHFGYPQDIEWCLAGDTFYIVQSRPITTLYPIPEGTDSGNRVFISVAHQQMMTDPMKPLGLSLFQLCAFRPMFNAGGRLFVDVTEQLASPAGRETVLNAMGQHDPLMKDALVTLIERGDFLTVLPADTNEQDAGKNHKNTPAHGTHTPIEPDPEIVSGLIKKAEAAIEVLKQDIEAKTGTAIFDFILEDIRQLKQWLADPQNMGVIMAAINASLWINKNMDHWLGEKNAADTLSQSVPNNITSEMGMELLNVADVIRPYAEVVDYLQHTKDNGFLDELHRFRGGEESRNAIIAFLNKYGMRCAGEIDLTKPRWSERPLTLIPAILNNIKNFEPGESTRRLERGLQESMKKKQELLDRLKQLPDGIEKAGQAGKMISLVRSFIGYREYPKYVMMNHFFIYRQALLKEAAGLVEAGVIHEMDDIYFLTFEELREAVYTRRPDYEVIDQRKEAYRIYEKLAPPRVITSDGEIVSGAYKRKNLPAGALVGLPVSSGVVEGRARVILDIGDASLADGDILVTPFTDPSWTPVFVSAKALVTEVGGLMTHGAVIAREYGLPAVVGVENATGRIRDGQRIRVNGTEGYVEVL